MPVAAAASSYDTPGRQLDDSEPVTDRVEDAEVGDHPGRLHVAVPGPGDPDATLRARGAGEATRQDWPEAWDGMVAYATTKGWLTENGQHLVAHVER